MHHASGPPRANRLFITADAHPCTPGPSHSSDDAKRPSTRKASQSQVGPPAKPFFLGIRGDEAHAHLPAQASAEQRPSSSDPKLTSRKFRPPPVSRTARATKGHETDTDAQLLASRKRSSAAFSIASVPGAPLRSSRSVDLLEAQSSIRPCDFKSRVLAAGTRDYGEDVAERNLGQNAADLTNPAVQAYYASLAAPSPVSRPRDDVASVARHNPLRSAVAPSAFAQQEEHAAGSQRHKHYSSVSAAAAPGGPGASGRQARASRIKSLGPTSLMTRPDAISGYPAPERGRRGRTGAGSSPKRRTRRGPSLERTPAPHGCKAGQSRKLAGQARHTEGPLATERSRPRSTSASPPHEPRYPTKQHQPPPAFRAHKSHKSHRSPSHDEAAETRVRTPRAVLRQGVRSLDKPIDPDMLDHDVLYGMQRADERAGQVPSRRPDSSSEESLDDRAPAPRWSRPLSPMTGTVLANSPATVIPSRRDQGWPTLTPVSQGAHAHWQSPWSHAHRDALCSGGASASLSRNGSCKSGTSAHTLTMDVAGHVPDRRSSLKHWSFSSITPTTESSDHSSTLAVRPRSIHTANTSIDLPPLTGPANLPELKESPSSSDSNGGPVSSSYVTALEKINTDTTVTSAPVGLDEVDSDRGQDDGVVEMAENGNGPEIDSSNVDFVAKPRQHRHGRGGEFMLFKQGGYSDLGNNLPGLFDTAARSPCLMCSLLESVAIGTASDDKGTEGQPPRAPCNHKGLNSRRERLRALGYEYDTDESESGPERAFRGRTRTPQQTSQPNASGIRQRDSWGTIEEEAEEDYDKVRAVPRLRRAPRGRSKRIEVLKGNGGFEPVLEDYEEGHAADVE